MHGSHIFILAKSTFCMPWVGSLWRKRAGIATPWKYFNTMKLPTNESQASTFLDQWEWTMLKYIRGWPDTEWHCVCLVFTWLPLQCVWLSIKKYFSPVYAKIQWQSHFLCIRLFWLDNEDYFIKDLSVCSENVSLMEFREGKCCLFFLFISLNNFVTEGVKMKCVRKLLVIKYTYNTTQHKTTQHHK